MNAVCGTAGTKAIRIWVSGWPGPGAPPLQVRDAGGSAVAPQIRWQVLPAPSGVNQSFGLLLLSGLSPNRAYSVAVQEAPGKQIDLHSRTLPDALPAAGVTLLLCSCYYQGDDSGELRAALEHLVSAEQPAVKLLVGDQVYADVPGFGLFAGSGAPEYAARYEEYWNSSHYAPFLRHGPNFFTCDDHEWWNNAPEFQAWLARSYHSSWKDSWAGGKSVYGVYQVQPNAQGGFWQDFRIGHVGIFLADTRSERMRRDQDASHFFSTPQRAALQAWAQNLPGPGFLVLGQPLFDGRGDWKDWKLPDYADDYRFLWSIVETSAHDIVVLSGDIHCGRLSRCPPPEGIVGRRRVVEFTASPMALVSPKPIFAPSVSVPGSIPVVPGEPQREIKLRFGTRARNFGLIHVRPAPMGAVDVRFVLWDLIRQRPAAWGNGGCESHSGEFILH